MVMGGKENQAFVLTADQGNEGKERKNEPIQRLGLLVTNS